MRTLLHATSALALAFLLGIASSANPVQAQRRPKTPRRPEPPAATLPASWASVQIGDLPGHALERLGDPELHAALAASDLPALANWLTARSHSPEDWITWLTEHRDALPTGLAWHTSESSAIGLGLVGRSHDMQRREAAAKRATGDVLELAFPDARQPFEMMLEKQGEDVTAWFDGREASPLPFGNLPYGTATLEYTARHFRRHRHAEDLEAALDRPVTPDLPEGVLLRATGPGDPLGLRALLLPKGTRCEGRWTLEVRAVEGGYRVVARSDDELLSDRTIALQDVRLSPDSRAPLADLHCQLYPRPDLQSRPMSARIPADAVNLTIRRDESADTPQRRGLIFTLGDDELHDLDALFLTLVRRAVDSAWWTTEGETGGLDPRDLRIVVEKPCTYGDVAMTVDALLDAGYWNFHFPR